METDVGAIAEGQQILSGDDVMVAQFKLQEATENGEPAQKLYLKTFQPIDQDMQIWQARPESEWPLLATIPAPLPGGRSQMRCACWASAY